LSPAELEFSLLDPCVQSHPFDHVAAVVAVETPPRRVPLQLRDALLRVSLALGVAGAQLFAVGLECFLHDERDPERKPLDRVVIEHRCSPVRRGLLKYRQGGARRLPSMSSNTRAFRQMRPSMPVS